MNNLLDKRAITGERTWIRIGTSVEVVASTTSTNDLMWQRADRGADDGTVILAEHQTSGRGRMGRTWLAAPGMSVMGSILLLKSHSQGCPPPGTLCLIAGIATASAIRKATGVAAQIAWPNDIVVEDKKIAGILTETRNLPTGREACVIGIGVNCLQRRADFAPEIAECATSVVLHSDRHIAREAIAGALISSLDVWLADARRWTDAEVTRAFNEHALPPGRTVRLRFGGREYTGEVEDVDPTAALVVRLPGGVRSVFPAAWTTVLEDGM